MFKAIIEKIENDGYSAKIRIPFFNGYSSSTGSTSDYELYTASICSAPGCDPAYREGDIVYIDFEDRDYGKPVIVGIFYREDYLSSANINSQSLSVAVSADFPEDVSIGNVGKSNIKSLTRISDNVQAQLTELDGSIKNVSTDIPTKVSQLENDLNFVDEDALQNVEDSIPIKVSQLTNDENYTDIEQLNNVSNMYIWRIYEDDGYDLGTSGSMDFFENTTGTIYYSSSISTFIDGSIELNNYNSLSINTTSSSNATNSVTNANNYLKGKFIKLNSIDGTKQTYYIDNSATFTVSSHGTWQLTYSILVDKRSSVTEKRKLYSYIGDNDKNKYPETGILYDKSYVLLDTIGNLFFKYVPELWFWAKYDLIHAQINIASVEANIDVIVAISSSGTSIKYSDSIQVNSDGSLYFESYNTLTVTRNSSSATNANTYLVGKYIYQNNYNYYFIPSGSTFTYRTSGTNYSYVLRASSSQLVTGVAETTSFNSYISDLDSDKYPINGNVGDYKYIRQYKLINKLSDFESRITALENASTT